MNVAVRRPPVDREFSPAAALGFWSCLLFSAALFALLALAPRLRAYREIGREYAALEQKLVAQERQVEYLGQVADALEHDNHFARELARVDFDAAGPEERIPVDPALSLQGGPSGAAPAAFAPANDASPARGMRVLLEAAVLDVFCDDRPVRSTLLGAAAFLVIVAFTLLCDAPDRTGRHGDGRGVSGRAETGIVARFGRALADRYTKRRRPD